MSAGTGRGQIESYLSSFVIRTPKTWKILVDPAGCVEQKPIDANKSTAGKAERRRSSTSDLGGSNEQGMKKCKFQLYVPALLEHSPPPQRPCKIWLNGTRLEPNLHTSVKNEPPGKPTQPNREYTFVNEKRIEPAGPMSIPMPRRSFQSDSLPLTCPEPSNVAKPLMFHRTEFDAHTLRPIDRPIQQQTELGTRQIEEAAEILLGLHQVH
jgi:hypothetical protein